MLVGRKRKDIAAVKKATFESSARQLFLVLLAIIIKVLAASITATAGYSCYFQTFRIFYFLF